jgi:hypothetical protein
MNLRSLYRGDSLDKDNILDHGGRIRLRENTHSIRTKTLANEYSTQRVHIRRLDSHTAIKVLFKTEYDKDIFLCP